MPPVLPLLLALALTLVARPSAALPALDATFRRLTTRDGLSHDSISAVLQDRQGFLWVGTAAGLNRYDGHQLRRYRAADDALAHDQITRLLEARDGTLWVATHDGLSRRDPATGRLSTPRLLGVPPLLGRLHINALAETSDGDLWIGTGMGLLRLNPQSLRVSHVLREPRVTQLLAQPEGALWIGSPDGALLRLDLATMAVAPIAGVPKLRQVRALLRAADGATWIAGVQDHLLVGRLEPRGARWRFFLPAQPSPALPLALAEDGAGGVFAGSDDGLWHADPQTGALSQRYQAQPRIEDALPDSFVAALHTDRQAGLWLGTTMGLLRLDLKPPRFPRYRQGLVAELGPPGGHVWALREDNEGGIWVGTRQGLGRLDRRAQRFHAESGVDAVRDLIQGPDGRLYVATQTGLLMLDNARPGAARRWLRRDPDGLPDERINRVLADGGFLYLGTASAGLCRVALPQHLDDALAVERFSCSIQDPARLPCVVTALLPASQGLLYVGGRSGLSLFDPRAGRVLRAFRYQAAEPESLSNSSVLSLARGRDGSLLIGTSGGLNQLAPAADPRTQPARFVRFTRPLLPDEMINGIAQDGAGALWLTTNDGLLQLDLERRAVQRFDVLDGLAANEFNLGAIGMTRGGEVLVGGPAGFNLFNPAAVRPDPTAPRARLTAVRWNGQPQPVSGELAPQPGLRRLELEFAVPSFDRSQRVRAVYRLEGLESAWTEAAGAGTVTYGALPPGRYRFQVRGRSADGVLEEPGVALTLRVEPLWWRTPLAYALWATLASLLPFSAHRLRCR